MYKNEEMYGESIEFYDIAALPHSNVNESILKKFARMTDMNEVSLWILEQEQVETLWSWQNILPQKN